MREGDHRGRHRGCGKTVVHRPPAADADLFDPVDPIRERRVRLPSLLILGALLAASAAWRDAGSVPVGPLAPDTYRVYVANESSDMVSRVAFTPEAGAFVEREIPVGIMPGDIDGAHGISVSPDGRYWYVTVAHGAPYGSVWQFHAGPDTLVGRAQLGLFPATMSLSPDGRFMLAVNFNLHGDMVPSNVSVVYTPHMTEIAKIETCLMPHGSRVSASGQRQYSVCMHSDQLVEIDLGSLAVSGRFRITPGHEGRLALEEDAGPIRHAREEATVDGPGVTEPRATGSDGDQHGGVGATDSGSGSSPAWAHPPEGAEPCSPTWVEPGQGPGADRLVYVACNKYAEVVEIDVEHWQVVRRFETGAGPYNLDVTPDGRLLVATLKGEQAIAVFDLESGEETTRLPTTRPVTHGVVISPDGRYAFVSNESVGSVPGTVDVFDLGSLERAGSAELGQQSGGIDFWSPPP